MITIIENVKLIQLNKGIDPNVIYNKATLAAVDKIKSTLVNLNTNGENATVTINADAKMKDGEKFMTCSIESDSKECKELISSALNKTR